MDSKGDRARILGISAYYHDSAAALLENGVIIAAAQEERYSRKKNDARFPSSSVQYCLHEAGLSLRDLDAIVFYDKPFIKFERLLETYLAFAPSGVRSFANAMPVWIKEKLFLKDTLKKAFSSLADMPVAELPPLLFAEHHRSHAASAFFPSSFDSAAILCMDGVGEWSTTTAWTGNRNQLTPLWEIRFPHSLGLLYSAFTYFTGFKVNSGEYKMMGLAPYGEPKYADLILDNLIDIKSDGTFRLNMNYFNYCTGLSMTDSRLEGLFGRPRREIDGPITQDDMDIAASIQAVTEKIVLRLTRSLRQETRLDSLCLAGGVALNCVANGRVVRESGFEKVWIQPAPGDAGAAVGAAAVMWHEVLGNARNLQRPDGMNGAYLGPRHDDEKIGTFLAQRDVPSRRLPDEELYAEVAKFLDDGAVVGWFQGGMEFGPRALGARSILGDPRNPEMQSRINSKIKFRESFRPFAPSVLEHRAADYFDLETSSPYMLVVAEVRNSIKANHGATSTGNSPFEKLREVRSNIPAVTHVDGSARIHTVSADSNPRFHALLSAFESRTGCAVLVNTSFNVRGEPIVCTPQDAYRCFASTDMDVLVMENHLVEKERLSKSQVESGRSDGETVSTDGDLFQIPNDKALRDFGLVMAGMIALIFGALIPWLIGRVTVLWPWPLAITFVIMALLKPGALGPVYKIWLRFGLAMNRVTSPLIMGAVFFLLVTPIGLLMRVLRRDPLNRTFDTAAESYRIPIDETGVEHPERPF